MYVSFEFSIHRPDIGRLAMSFNSSLRWRLGAIAVLLGGLIAATLIWQAVSEAGAPAFSPRVLASFKDKQLQLSIGLPAAEKPVSGKVSVELLDSAGKALGSRESKLTKFDSTVEVVFSFADVNKADADNLRLRVKFKGKQTEVPLAKVLLGKGHETTIHAGADFHAGSQGSILVTVQGIRTVAESVPHVGSYVSIHLFDAKKNKTHVCSGLTDKDGWSPISTCRRWKPAPTRWRSSPARRTARRSSNARCASRPTARFCSSPTSRSISQASSSTCARSPCDPST
jgi:hypothetical protein